MFSLKFTLLFKTGRIVRLLENVKYHSWLCAYPLRTFLSMRAVVAYFGTQHGRRNQIFTLIAVLVVGSSNRKHKCLPQLAGLVQVVLRDADEVQVRNVDRRLKVLRKRVYILLYIVL